MFFRSIVAFFMLLISGCGVSGLAHNEYITFSPEEQKELFDRETYQARKGFFWKIFTDKSQQYAEETKELVQDGVVFEFVSKEGGFAGVFPLIPILPYMPVFLKDSSFLCPIASDLRMSIRFIDEKSVLGEDKAISEYLKQPDISKIYLLKENGEAVLPRHLGSDGYSYQICFPLKMEESDNTVLVVDDIVTQQNKKIRIEPQRLRYYDEYAFGMGYWGSFMHCEFNAVQE